jgi:adenylosuccinate synthase
MNKRARVVIGANFGDEGKGLLVDRFAADTPGAVVARFNGGAQAGHTVITPGGTRHVFGHFGAGMLASASTVLTRDFIVNPILFHKERRELLALGVRRSSVTATVDPRCLVTTPFDMWLNQLAEDARGANRHGSVGVGINETVERTRHGLCLTADMLADASLLRSFCWHLQRKWLERRAEDLGCIELFYDRLGTFDLAGIVARWIADCATFLDRITLRDDVDALADAENIIFEGAQGLGLDQAVHPIHSTPSNTGLTNVVPLAEALDLALDVTYVTRAYLTRHGAGPLDGELDGPPYPGIKDSTNLTHPYQGTLRFAHLDVPALWARIERDYLNRSVERTLQLAVTCLDQVPEHFTWIDGAPITGSATEFLKATGAALASWGPTREAVYTTLEEHAAA